MSPSLQNAPSASPLFRQIVDLLTEEIQSGILPEHAALPSERVIAEQHGVSRMTARRALQAIEAEGLAYSEGRRGRFVSPQRLTYDISRMISFTADAQARGTDLQIEMIETRETVAYAHLAQRLGIATGDVLFAYTRLFRSRGHAVFIETEQVAATRFPGLLQHDLRQSSTQLLERHYGTRAHIGDVSIQLCVMTGYEAKLLGCARPQAGMELHQIIRDRSGTPFCASRQIWRGELAEFTARAIVDPSEA